MNDDPEIDPSPGSAAWLHRAIEHAAHLLPAQAPLEVFVHHNTLHALQHMPFHEAIREAESRGLGRGYWPEPAYREAYRRGRITDDDLEAAMSTWAVGPRGAAWPDLPSSLPSPMVLAKWILIHGIEAESPAGLAWRLTERGAAERFDDAVFHVARERILHASREAHGAASSEDTVSDLWRACREATRGEIGEGLSAAAAEEPDRSPRDAILRVSHEDPNDLVHPVLISLAGAFLDRGQSRWSMPDREQGFFVAFCRILGAGHAVRPAWLKDLGRDVRALLKQGISAEEAVCRSMDEMAIPEEALGAFIERTLLQLPGWAGMFRRLETAPGPAGRSHARVRLLDFLAVRLILDVLALRDIGARLGHRGPLSGLGAHLAGQKSLRSAPRPGDHDRTWPLFLLVQHIGLCGREVRQLAPSTTRSLLDLLRIMTPAMRLRIWEEAFEHHYRSEVLTGIALARQHGSRAEGAVRSADRPEFQVVMCIDDREESLRRHFEEMSPDHVTFGTAGFFNLAIAYQGIDDPATFPLCPVVVSPRHMIREEPLSEHAPRAEARERWRRRMGRVAARFDDASRSVFWGPIVVALTGLAAALPLLAAVFAPWWAATLKRRVGQWLLPAPKTRLAAPRTPGEERTSDFETGAEAEAQILNQGFSHDEKAERVGALLENIGLTRGFAKVVALLGHDGTSVNNPHFAAYSCGACGGRSGGPNARLFARMANRPEVRALLARRGIIVPEDTVFVGGVHNSTTDAIDLFDESELPPHALPEVGRLERALSEAARHNAHERCRKLASAPKRLSPAQAKRHVEQRSFDLSQARPELGHATNACCVVGRRALTQHLFLDRRAFLVSYDPKADPSGVVLERTLAAVGPVGSGINLEYYFSAADNPRFGAGTKLPHNVVALSGVMDGASSDLRTGLPFQMVEVHEPMRLLMIVETEREILTGILERQPLLRELLYCGWVRFATIDPDRGEISVVCPEPTLRFLPFAPKPHADLQRAARSRDYYEGKDGFLAPALVTGKDNTGEMRDVA